MIRAGLITLALLWPTVAVSKTANLPDIRTVETDSTDIFEILHDLSTADDALAARDYIAARRGYESVLLHDPTLQTARAGLRRSLIALGQIETAATLIDDPNSADAVLIDILLGVSDDPIPRLNAALKRHSDARLWNLLGRLHDRTGQFSSARQSYAMAGMAGQRPGLSFNNIGQSHWLAGEHQKALEAFTKAVAADPTDTRFDNNRRRALMATGNLQAAVSGLNAQRASVFLAQAGDQAKAEGETRLAAMLYQKSLDFSPRHDPHIAAKLAGLEK